MILHPVRREIVNQMSPKAKSALGARIAWYFGTMRAEFGANGPRIGVAVSLAMFVLRFLSRAFHRLDRLIHLWETNRLPAPRPPRPRKPRPTPAEATEPKLRMPNRKAWMAAAGSHFCGAAWSFVVQMEKDPDFVRVLAECPQAMRILRPLLHWTGQVPPPAQRLPPRPRKPRPKKPAPPPETGPQGKYPNFNPRTYSPGMIDLPKRRRR